MDTLKQLLPLIVQILGIPAALYTAWRAIFAFRENNAEKARATAQAVRANEEKTRENRHRQAAAALACIKELFANEKARAAMQMLDWSGRSYSDGKTDHTVAATDLTSALRADNTQFVGEDRYKQVFIRDCFETLFDQIELIAHFESIDFLHFHDVAVPLAYYAKLIAKRQGEFDPFLTAYGYPKARAFLLRAASES